MKLYSVTAYYHKKYEKRDWIETEIIMAETEEEARAIFDREVTFPANAKVLNISVFEHKNGTYKLSAHKCV